MKEHFQDFGVRKWAGDDLIELQAEPLAALQGLVAPYAPCILQGCEMTPETDGAGVTRYKVSAGLAALKGEDASGNACVKIVRVAEETKLAETVYLYLACESKSRTYADGKNKVITYEYKGKFSNQPVEGALKISKDDGGPRLVDKLGITQKLNAVDGNARDVVVTFAESSSEGNRPELKSGSRLGLLLQQIRQWFDELKDLKALAFKDNVAEIDLEAALSGKVNAKLDWEGGEAKDVVVGFTEAITRSELTTGSKLGVLFGLVKKWCSDLRALAFKDKVALADLDADVKEELKGKVSKEDGKGLSQANFTTEEKLKLDGIANGANKYVHPTGNGNNHIPSGGEGGDFLRWSTDGTAKWEAGDYASRTDSRLTDSRPPKGTAGGDLTGDYPNPSIKSSVILKGTPTAPTPDVSDNSTRIATTSHVHSYASPLVHRHAELTGIPDTRNVVETPDSYNGGFHVKGAKNRSVYGVNSWYSRDYVQVLGCRGGYGFSDGAAHEFALTDNGSIQHRYERSNGVWSTWEPLAHVADIAWGTLKNKPSVFTPASHSHSEYSPKGHGHPEASTSGAGFLSAKDKKKLDGIGDDGIQIITDKGRLRLIWKNNFVPGGADYYIDLTGSKL